MTEQTTERTLPRTRPILCDFGTCTEPATVEIEGPDRKVACEECAAGWIEDVPEGWEHEGVEPYARMCEEAVNVLARIEGEYMGHAVLEIVLMEARGNLERHELKRAREKLVEAGGTPRLTTEERTYLDFYRECAKKYGWTEPPRWIAQLMAWEAATL